MCSQHSPYLLISSTVSLAKRNLSPEPKGLATTRKAKKKKNLHKQCLETQGRALNNKNIPNFMWKNKQQGREATIQAPSYVWILSKKPDLDSSRQFATAASFTRDHLLHPLSPKLLSPLSKGCCSPQRIKWLCNKRVFSESWSKETLSFHCCENKVPSAHLRMCQCNKLGIFSLAWLSLLLLYFIHLHVPAWDVWVFAFAILLSWPGLLLSLIISTLTEATTYSSPTAVSTGRRDAPI